MRKPKPLNLSSCEEISRDEMRSMVAGSINEAYYYTSGSGVDSGTALWEAAKAACYGKSAGDDCEFGYGGGLPYYGKCGYASSGTQRVLVCGSSGSGSGSSGTSGGATWWDDIWNKKFKPQREGCNGKQTGDACTWTSNGSTKYGTCNFDYTTHYLLCVGNNDTGELSERQAACLNKSPGQVCWYGSNHGYCRLDNFDWYKKLLACYTDISTPKSNDSENK